MVDPRPVPVTGKAADWCLLPLEEVASQRARRSCFQPGSEAGARRARQSRRDVRRSINSRPARRGPGGRTGLDPQDPRRELTDPEPPATVPSVVDVRHAQQAGRCARNCDDGKLDVANLQPVYYQLGASTALSPLSLHRSRHRLHG